MPDLQYDLGFLTNPQVFALGRMPAFSDHDVFIGEEKNASLSLNGVWKFHYAENLKCRPEGFADTAYDVSEWDDFTVPGHIQMRYGKPQYVNIQYPWDGHEKLEPPMIPQEHNPVGSYVRFFEVPQDWKDKRIVLTFHGVETAFFCWVNGRLIGYSEDSFTPAHFDITAALQPGMNRLAVEVFRFSSASWIEDQDFWRFSGIFRDVELHAWSRAHVRDLFVHAEPDEALRVGALRTELKVDLPADEEISLQAKLLDDAGTVIDSVSLPAAAEMEICHEISNPRLWSAEAPNLYTLEIMLSAADGTVIETARTRVGFRRFEMKNGLMMLNGKRIVFHGADRHEFCAESGRCITKEHMLADIRAMKRNNINAVRTSHYPNQSYWYRLCDEYGVYVIDETNIESHGTWQNDEPIRTAVPCDKPEWLDAVLDRAQSMLERDKNHPSVLIWSCGNESFGGHAFYTMSCYFRQRDPSRLVHYESVYYDRRYNQTSDMESQMYTPAAKVAAFIEEHPEKPFILCEYAHAMGNSCGALHKYIELEDRYPRYQGGFIWDFIDQAIWMDAPNGKRRLAYGGDFGDRPTDRDFCGNGLFFADRKPTPRLQEVKYLYQPVRIMPDESGVTVENRQLFENLDRYLMRWQLRRDGILLQAGALRMTGVEAGGTKRFTLPVAKAADAGEYVLHCGLYLVEETAWADTEYELMHGEAVIAAIPHESSAPCADGKITLCQYNAGVRGEAYEFLFSKAEGGLSSIRGADGLERLCTAPALSLYRAPTNNDIGNNDWRAEGYWLGASVLATPVPAAFEEKDGLLHVSYRYELPQAKETPIIVDYTAIGKGRLLVEMNWSGNAALPDMEAFGLSFRLPCGMGSVRYYGLGPEENYCDRKHGAKLGVFSFDVRDNLTPYLQPQECGNREGVRFIEITDGKGRGLRVEQVDVPLSVSVLPHSMQELMAARHQDELAEPCYTYLDIALCRKGVGGDNSWGEPVHPEYHIPAAKPMKLSFVLTVI